MTDALVIVTEEPPIATVELNRKKQRNALSAALRDAIEEALDRLARDERIRAVVLTGGEDYFSAGFDLKEMVETELRALFHRGVEFTLKTYFFAKPLVTAVGGFALAGGFDLAISGDVIVASEGAQLGRPEVKWGINPLMTKLWLRVGMARALRLSMSGASLEAREAMAIGLVDRVVPKGSVIAAAREEAMRIAELPLPALLAVKRAARTVPSMDPATAIEHELGISAELVTEGTLAAQLREYARRVGVLKA